MTETLSTIVDTLSRSEKLSLVHGAFQPPPSDSTTGYLPGLADHGIPPIRMADGPLGIRSGTATAFPAALALGATFDPGLAAEMGRAIGAEARNKGIDVVLAPGCNLVRLPQGGRSFEYYSEDPRLTAELTVGSIQGIQTHDVVATPKHYVANNQEHARCRVSASVSERALRELYLPAFEAAVTEADAGAVMAAYNRINGTDASEHERLLTAVLKEEFGFEGPVMSDWWGVDDGLAAARAGLDLEMPGVGLLGLFAMMSTDATPVETVVEHWPDAIWGPEEFLRWVVSRTDPHGGIPAASDSLFAAALPAALSTGRLSGDRLDEMVTRVLTIHDRVGALGDGPETVTVDRNRHRDLAATAATRGTVLLENDGVLPLDPDQRVAVFGPSPREAKLGGGGSSSVTPERTVDPVSALRDRATSPVRVGGHHPSTEDEELFDFGLPELRGQSADPLDVAAVERTATSSDVAVVIAEDTTTEGADRESLALPAQQDRLVAAVAAAAEQTVVVLQTAGPVEMPWLAAVDAVVESWYPGQEAGRALAEVLYGESDPGGRLPVTFAPAGQYPATATANYPGVDTVDGYPEARYDEGVFVGYRHFDDQGSTPTFPFGHGHSYAAFEYDDIEVVHAGDGTVQVSVTVTNTAQRQGREVVQVYRRDPDPPVPRPPRELVGFESLALGSGESRRVTVRLAERDFAFYDESAGAWRVSDGEFGIEVGHSSRAVRASTTVHLE